MKQSIKHKLIVDLFAGGGGVSEGIFLATGCHPDIAINHSDDALSMHRVNHPHTRHFIADVYEVCPLGATQGKPVGWLHLSPDCTHHSQAAGGQPRSKKIRGLAWVGYRWAGQVKPDVISLENVTQILKWGPLIAKRDKNTNRVITLDMVTCPVTGRKTNRIADPGERVPVQQQYLVPDPKRSGQTWRRFTGELRKLGYDIECRTLCAADYGVPTTRERLFMIARRDGQPIHWPEPTHFKKPIAGQAKWRSAAECIDFSIPCQSIFNRKKPLAEATLKRIAKGLQRYVLDSADPFIVQIAHYNGSDRAHSISDPLKTITASTKGGEFALAAPIVVSTANTKSTGRGPAAWSIEEPSRTVTASGGLSLAAPIIVQAGHGEGKPGSTQRRGVGSMDMEYPLGTVVSSGGGFSLSMAYLAQMNGGFNETTGRDLSEPMTTITNSGSQQQMVTAFLSRQFGNSVGQPVTEPAPTVMTDGLGKTAVVSTLLEKADAINGHCSESDLGRALRSACGRDHVAIEDSQSTRRKDFACSAPSRTANEKRIYGTKDECPGKSALGICASSNLDGAERSDPGWHAAQSHRREQDQQQPGESGISNAIGKHSARLRSRAEGQASKQAGCSQDGGKSIAPEGDIVFRDCESTGDFADLSVQSRALRVAAFLIRFYSEGGQHNDIADPMATITTKDRLALVTVTIEGHPYIIVDIGLRMLQPAELFSAQGFRQSYEIEHGHDGRKFTKTTQVRLCGNSVPPDMMAALVMANHPASATAQSRSAA